MISSLIDQIGEFLFPSFCCHCKSLGPYLCDSCYELLQFYLFPIELEQNKLSPLFLDKLIAAVEYEPVIGSLLHYLKYKHSKFVAFYLADFLYFTTQFPAIDLVASVPLHPLRRNERGYNQSELISKRFAKLAHLNYVELLRRTKLTPSQASLQFQNDRLSNLKGIFDLNCPSHIIRGKRILLIDDVCTTGSTLNECAKVLKQYGAHSVIGLTVAHGS